MADVTDVTQGTLVGTGYFDKFMAAINAQIDAQYTAGRIQGKDYATVYLGALQTALTQAVAYVGVVGQRDLLDQKIKTEKAQILDDLSDTGTVVLGAVGQQKLLQAAQANGFLRDAEQKATKILLDTWSISKSVVGTNFPEPAGATNFDLEDMIIKLREGIGITESIYAGVADAGPNQTVAISSFVQLTATGTSRPGVADALFPPSGFIWTQLSGTTQTLVPTVGVETTEIITTIATVPATPETLVFKLEAKYANSLPTTSSFDTVTIVVE